MDRITESLLGEFVRQNGLENLPESEAFEQFTGYLVTSKHFTENFPPEEVHVGAGGGDGGIDNVAIIVNGALVSDPSDIESFETLNGSLDVTFVFNQADRGSSFEASKLSNFAYGVLDFFKSAPTLPQNPSLKNKWAITNEILSRSSKFRNGNPQCFLYYSTTGKWTGDQTLSARRESVINDLAEQNLFRKIDFEFVDAEKIQKLFQETKNAISRKVNFTIRAVLPDLPEVEQAYIGVLGALDYLKLIENTDEAVVTSIFTDNVRHWQEWNPVNSEMRATLTDPNARIYFPLLNNGVTIVAKRIVPTGNTFVIEDYQIVNGCQTSYVLYESKDHLTDDVLVPVRLIATQNTEVRNSIIKATNRQTPITEDQLFAVSDFPKKLEAYFPTFDGKKRLFYERRSRQYNSEAGIEKVRVINMTNLVRAYASMFLEVPHKTTTNIKGLFSGLGKDTFVKGDCLEMYYVSGYAHYRVDYLFRNGSIGAELKPARYQLLYLFRKLAIPGPLPRRNSHEMERYCKSLMDILWDDGLSNEIFTEAAAIVKDVAGTHFDRDYIRTVPFTDGLKGAVESNRRTWLAPQSRLAL